MNKNYFIKKIVTTMLLLGMVLLGALQANSQSVKSNVKNPNEIEEKVEGISEQLGQDLLINKMISKAESKLFVSHYASLMTDIKADLYKNIQDDSINDGNVGRYIKIMDARLSALYDQYKALPLEEQRFGGTEQVEANPSTVITWPGACESSCNNTDFSAGTLANWMTCYSKVTTATTSGPFTIANPTCTGILAGTTSNSVYPTTKLPQVQIVTAASGNDPVCGAFIPQLCNNPNFTGTSDVEIGDYNNPNYGVGILEQQFTVTPANCDFTYWYAVVLENPSGHGHYGQPFFNVFMYDQAGNLIPFCGNYAVTADSASAQGNFKGFYYAPSGDTCYCRPWTQVFVPLKAYIGQCVTIKVVTADCYAGGHFGYGYFAAKCASLGIITSSPTFCGNPITLTGPTGGAAYQWTGPGAGCMTPAAGNTQTITVNCPGKYTCIVYSYIGAACADTVDTVITSSTATAPKPFFSADTVCVGNPTQFTNLTTGGNPATNQYVWTFQGGTTSSAVNPTFTFPAAGSYPATYTVTLQALNGGCGGDTTLNVVVNGPPTAGFSAPNVCQNSQTLFTNTSTGTATFKWSFGDGSTSSSPSPQHTYATCGTYTVTLVAGVAPCVDSAKNTITVYPNPTPVFTASPVCLGSNTVFTDGTTVGCGGTEASWSWIFGDPGSGAGNTSTAQNPTHVFADTGCYSVSFKITTNNGCADSVTKPVCIVGPPTPKFTSSPVCLGLPTVFTNQTVPATSTSKWSFGDPANGTSTATNPTYTYTTAGTYTVKLISTSGAGCVDSTTSTVTVNPPPTAGFTADTVCLGNPTAFKDTSHGGTSYSWSFGDAAKGTSAVQNPTYTYATSGTFQVKEVVTTASGCKDSITLPVVVNPAPTATIVVPPVCLGNPSVFTLTPSEPCSYSWTMGDGVGTSTAQNPSYTYSTNGSYTATVILTSTTGSCPGKATAVAIVNPIPVANFSAPAVCQDVSAVFKDLSTVANNPAPQAIKTWAWSFGDGGTSTVQNPSHHYAACGTYNVTLAVTTVAGCTHDTTLPIIINPVPAPNFTVTSVCKGFITNFTDKSTIGCGDSITKWNWNFGDGSGASTLQNPTHTYPGSGTFNATLTVTSSNGCDSSISLPVIVYPIPVPAFTASQPCFGTPTNFTDNSTVTGGSISAENWTFGDGTAGTGATTSHTYPAAGTYNVELIVTSNHGCIDSITQPVIINPIPVPLFASDTVGCTPLCVTDTDKSSVAAINGSNINQWLWNFGDGSNDSSSTVAQPNHCYTKPGTYSVTLTVTTNHGCTATLVRPNYVTAWPLPVACFTANPTTLQTLTDSTVYFTDCSSGNPVRWLWETFGDQCDSIDSTQNTVHTYQQSCTHSFQDTGTYCTKLIVTNKFGCKDSTTNCIHIGPMWTFYVPNAFTPNNDGLNDGFIPKAVGVISFQMWIFDRWGQMLYHCTSLTQPWDGTVHTGPTSGQECQEDTYVWLVEFTDVFRNSHREVGRVTIIR